MDKTKDLLIQIKKLVKSGRLNPKDVPVNDIIECVKNEIELNKNTYTQKQYNELVKYYSDFCRDINEEELDLTSIKMLIDGMFISLSTVSQAVSSLISKDYWTYKHGNKATDPEVAEIIDYIERKGKLQLLNYDFVDKYIASDYNAYYDDQCEMYYIPYKKRNMYFPKGWDINRILDYYCSVISEQDTLSPHCYKKDGYEIKKGSTIIDVGAAEGIFSLDNIDSAEKVYLIEADELWIDALQHTFANDLDKVIIVQGYAGDNSINNSEISLDSLVGECQSCYIKMDIEGYEKNALNGTQQLLNTVPDIICAICSYHCKDDETWIQNFLSERGFKTSVSRGYIFPDWEPESIINAELRRGIVFGKK